jgi:uncharacterized protein (DUF1015 family)
MADVFPFRALRYNPDEVDLATVVTQPYDKITPEMQARYYDASAFNLVRIELGRPSDSDNDGDNVYTRAAAALHDWRERGILRLEPRPAIFRYSQSFTAPAGSALAGQQFERSGFIALGQLEDYRAGIVFRHEQTHSGPKLDRLRLLRATRAHIGQLFMLYRDRNRRVETLLATAEPPVAATKDEYGVVHRLWHTADEHVITQVQDAMRDQQLIIADGHHRYETALAYRNERREEALQSLAAGAASGAGTGTYLLPPEASVFERAMMTFVNVDSPGLLVLPTHRVVFGLPNFESGVFVSGARQCFDFQQVPGSPDPEKLLAMIGERRPGEIKLAAVTRLGAWLLAFRPRDAQHLIGALSPRQQQLDVVVLHRVLLNEMLGISEDAIRELRNIAYYRDAREAVERVRAGADAAFLLNPVSVQQVADIALAGETMPQKSTDFYPKLLSGLTIYALE